MVDFAMPPVSPSFEGWGPKLTTDEASGSSVWDFAEHLEKFPLQRIAKPVDFTAAGQKYWAERAAKGKGKGKDGKGKTAPILQLGKDDEGFSLVDNRPAGGKPVARKPMGGRNKGKGKGLAVNYQEGILGQKTKPTYQTQQNTKGKGKGKGGAQRRREPSFKDWSVTTKTEWAIKWEFNLSALSKPLLDSNLVQFEDVAWCGKLHTYNKMFDRITAKTEKPLRRFEELNFFNVTTSEDPMLQELLQDEGHGATVIATDHVLAALIAAGRSVYSWDVVVTKIAGKLIFDKRDGSQLDFLSVNESASDPPNNEDPEAMNAPLKLSQEASCINQNFTQMVLELDKEPEEMEHPNPFTDEEEGDARAASGAYRYRKITLPGNAKAEDDFKKEPVTIIARTEVNGRMADTGGYVSVKALNEYDPRLSSWRTALESQRGACLATEIKNNSFKLGRWTAQAVLAGCDSMKIGYVSRMQPNDPWNHSILGVISHHTDGFADQIGMTRHNMYGILRTFIDTIMEWDDGKYLIMKDPIKSVLRIYEVPWEAFNEEEGDDEDEEVEEDPDLDEDGNVRPQQD